MAAEKRPWSLFGLFRRKKHSSSILVSQKRRIAELIEQEVVLEQKAKEANGLRDRTFYLKQKEAIRWEVETFIIQNSTRTTFPQFLRLHDKLRMKYRWYYNWHLLPYAGEVHWASLFCGTSALIFLVVFSALAGLPSKIQAHKEPKLVVQEINPEKMPQKFFLKNPSSGKFEDVAQVISEESTGTKIRTKSATEAGFQDILINGNEQALYDGDTIVAQAQVIAQEKVDGKWQDMALAIEETPTPTPEPTEPPTSPTPEPSPSPTESPGSTPTPEPSPEETTTPEAMIHNLIKEAKAAETSPTPEFTPSVVEGPTLTPEQRPRIENKVKKEHKDEVIVDALVNLASDQELLTRIDLKKEGQGKNQQVLNKQTFSLDKGGNPQRLVWQISLRDFDITADNADVKAENANGKTEEPVKRKEYGNTIIDVSDFKGDIRWQEIAATDTVRIYFDEEGTTKAIKIDPLLTVTQPANQISVDDGTRKWVFDTATIHGPQYFYHDNIGSGSDNIATTYAGYRVVGPGFSVNGSVSSVTHTLVENTPTRVKVRLQGSYGITPTSVDNYYTIYPSGHAFLQYSAATSTGNATITQHYPVAASLPQVKDRDAVNHTFVQSDTSNNDYPGMSVVPYTTTEFGGASGWSSYNDQGNDLTLFYKVLANNTYTGNMVIDFSNYRATTTTRDNLRNDYRNPATLANFDKGSQAGDGYNEAEGAYTIAADASGDAKFDFQPGAYTRYKPAFKITSATRAEDNYQVKVQGVRKTKGIDYNLSKIDATTVIIQWLSDVSSNLINLELAGPADVTDAQIAVGWYTGNGVNATPIAGIGFQPDLVIIKSETTTQFAVFRTVDMGAGDITLELANPAGNFANGIESLDADGFTVGDDVRVNQNTIIYHWQAFKKGATQSTFATGTYTGNSVDNRDVVTGLPFQPAIVGIKRDGASLGVWKPSSLAGGDTTYFSATALTADRIQALNTDGFQVGTDAEVNANGATYYWFAFAEVGGWIDVGSYLGNYVDSRSITGVGFQPNLVWIKTTNPVGGAHRPSSLGGDSTLCFHNGAAIADSIQALEADGFQIGFSNTVNTAGWTYHYAAFKAGTVILSGNKIWDGGGGDNNWSTGANWTDDTVPIASDNVVFGSTSTKDSTIDAGFAGTINSITIGTGYTGTITANRSLTIKDNFSLEQGTFDAGAQTINVAGNWSRVGGTFTAGTSTINMNATSTGKTILSGGQSFYNLIFNGVGGGWTLQDDLTSTNLSITDGTLIDNAKQVTVNGNILIDDEASRLTSTGTWVQGASGNIRNPNTSNQFYNLTLAGAGVTSTMTGYVRVGAGIVNLGPGILNGGNNRFFMSPSADNRLIVNSLVMGTSLNYLFYDASTNVSQQATTLPNNFGRVHFRTAGDNITATGNFNFGNNPVTVETPSAALPTNYLNMGSSTLTSGDVQIGYSTDATGYLKLGSSLSHSVGGIARTAGNTSTNHLLEMDSSTITASGDVDFTGITVTSVTPGSSKLVMNGDGKVLTGNNQFLNNLQISNNISTATPSIYISGTLTIDNGKTLTIVAVGYVHMISGSTTTINGTIAGCCIYFHNTAGANLSTTGTLSSTVFFDASISNVVVPARTYGGLVYFRNTSASGYTATLGTAGSQTLTFSSSFQVVTSAAGNMTVKADTWNPNINITSNLLYIKATTGIPSISMGSSTWTVGGNIDLTNGTIDAGTSTLVMTGAGKTLTSNGQSFYNLILPPTSSSVTLADDLDVTGDLKVDNGYRMKVGSYVGNGVDDRAITGVGFQPDLVIIKSQTTTQYAVFRTSDMVGDFTLELANAAGSFANGIQSLDTDGFTVGDDLRVNQNTIVFHWQAFSGSGSESFSTGTYTGNGVDNRDITGLSFQPAIVVVKRDGASNGVWRPSSLSGDATLGFVSGSPAANVIQALNSDGFQVGTSSAVNTTGQYYWFAFAKVLGWITTGSYIGDGVDNRSITGVGFQPNLVWVRHDTWSSVSRPSSLVGDLTLWFHNAGQLANAIQALEADGFQVGTYIATNENSWTHYYAAWKQTTNSTLNFNGKNISVTGDFSVGDQGTISTAGTTVTLNGTSGQTVTSSGQQFNNLTINNSTSAGVTFADAVNIGGTLLNNTAGSKMTFADGVTHTINTINWVGTDGDVGNNIKLRSTNPGTQYDLTYTTLTNADYLDVQDSNNTSGTTIEVARAKDSGNNTDWYLTDEYTVTTNTPQVCGVGWSENLQAEDFYNNNISSTPGSDLTITMTSSSANVKFYTNNTYVVEITTYILASGAATIYLKDNCVNNETITYTGTDTYGTTKTSGNIAVGNDPPTATITSPATGAIVGAGTVQIAGTAVDTLGGVVALVEIQIDAGAWTAATGTTSWSYNYAVTTSGTHTVKARATDSLGLVGPESATITFQVDVEIPSVVITKPVVDEWITTDTYTVEGTSQDLGASPIAKIEISFNEGSWHEATSTSTNFATWTYDWTAVNGDVTIEAKATDGVGNISQTYEVKAKVDINPPTKPESAKGFDIANKMASTKGVLISWKASTDEGSGFKEYEIYRGTEKAGTSTIDSWYIDENGTAASTYTVKALDNAGNSSDSDSAEVETVQDTGELKLSDIKAAASTLVDKDEKTYVIITWKTEKPATSQVAYGLGGAKGNQTKLDGKFNTSHLVVVSDLRPQTTYHYSVSSTDMSGSKVESPDQTFTTATSIQPDNVWDTILKTLQKAFEWLKKFLATSPPVKAVAGVMQSIGLIKSPEQVSPSLIVLDTSNTGADLYQTVLLTNQKNASIERSTDAQNFSSLGTAANGYYHDTGLDKNTTYTYRLKGDSGQVTVKPSSVDTSAPKISEIKSEELLTTAEKSSYLVTFQTDKLAKAEIDIGEKTYAEEGVNQSHSLVLDDLKPQETYKYQIKAVTEQEQTGQSTTQTITTKQAPTEETIWQLILNTLQGFWQKFAGWMKT